MEKYNAWIKELSTIVYDNSKSEYQILSELIPILLNIKSSQDTNSELMDTIHDTVFNKVNELESGMTTFSETFTQKLNEFKQEFNTQTEEFTSTLESNIAEFKEKINNKISTFNTTYASTKASIQEIADSINNINDTLISGYNEIINKINNFVELIINSSSDNIIDSAIEEKFTPTYLARESIYIDLVSVTTQPTTANEGDIYYNASEYQLYKYTGGAWVEENYTINKLYRYQSNLYHIDMIKTDKTMINRLNQTLYTKGRGDTFIGSSGNSGNNIKFNINNINGGSQQVAVETYPENWSTHFTYILYNETNDLYYMIYNNLKYIATSTDLINWTFLTEYPSFNIGIANIINGILYCDNYKFSNNEWIQLPYIINGYGDNKFWRVSYSDKAIYTATSDDFSDEELYCATPYSLNNKNNFYYNNGLLIIDEGVFYNKEYVGNFSTTNVAYGNSKCNFLSNYILTNNSNVIIQRSNVFSYNTILNYDENYTIFSFDNNQTNRYILRVGLLPYE